MREDFGLNTNALGFWRSSGYSNADVDNLCNYLNHDWMLARISFSGDGNASVTISQKTWQRQEGHYPTIFKFFDLVAKHPALKGKAGSFVVWLEDGLWEPHLQHTFRAPILSFGRFSGDHQSFLIPDPAYLGELAYKDEIAKIKAWNSQISFADKKPTVFWRGAATGICIENELWITTARGRLVLLANRVNNPDIIDAKITKIDHLPPEQKKIMADQGVLGEACEFKDFLNYRYIVDADGYCCAWKSLFLKLASNSLVLKILSDYEQWYFDKLIPWYHYVPLTKDLGNFNSVFKWLTENNSAAEQIVKQANQFIESFTYERSIDDVSRLCAAILDTQRY